MIFLQRKNNKNEDWGKKIIHERSEVSPLLLRIKIDEVRKNARKTYCVKACPDLRN